MFLNLCSVPQIPLPDGFHARSDHSTGVLYVNPTRVKTVTFGGVPDNPTKYQLIADYPSMAQTTIVDLGEWTYMHVYILTVIL